ncbi:MAG: histidine phosphatase family protein [Pseudomonadota bacterium]
MPAPRTLWLVRHAVPLVVRGTCYGRLDLPADAAATQQAAATLAAAVPAGARLVASPLQRCAQLAEALQVLRPDLRRTGDDSRIAEMDFGDWEGQAWNALDPAALAAWTADFARHRPGGGESVADFLARVGSAWDDLHTDAPATPTVWVTHAGVIRAATLLAAGRRTVERATDWPAFPIGFGQWRLQALVT